MIERVAKAIKSGMEDSEAFSLVANGSKSEAALQQFLDVLAMDAIEAMREPTEAMVSAGDEAKYTCSEGINLSQLIERSGIKAVFAAMVDAALSRS